MLRPTSHTRLRARDHCASSTLIGGKGGAGPSSLQTTLEGPTEYVTMVKENRRLVHYQPMDFSSWPVQISNHRMAIRL